MKYWQPKKAPSILAGLRLPATIFKLILSIFPF
nr:MAG TPA: hypothetical protein [Crassvirales sp.]